MIKQNTDMIFREFTTDNSLASKKERRQRLISLSIDEKIKIVEELREKVIPIRKFKFSEKNINYG